MTGTVTEMLKHIAGFSDTLQITQVLNVDVRTYERVPSCAAHSPHIRTADDFDDGANHLPPV